MNKRKLAIFIVAFLFTLSGMLAILNGLIPLGKIYETISGKDKTTGVVVNSRLYQDGDSIYNIVDYQYTIKGINYKGTATVVEGYPKVIGDKINVYYNPNQVSDSMIIRFLIIPFIVITIVGFAFFTTGIALLSGLVDLNGSLHLSDTDIKHKDLPHNPIWRNAITQTKLKEDERNKRFKDALKKNTTE